jgi:hypothetical protein
MAFDPHGAPHEPGEPEPRWVMPEAAMLVRGLGLAVLALLAGRLAVGAIRTHWLMAPLSAVLGMSSLLAGWAAVIHLTGGEKFDDHPFI